MLRGRRDEALNEARRKRAGEKLRNCESALPGGSVFPLPICVKSEPRYLVCYEVIERAGSVRAPGPGHFNKEQTPLDQLALPTRGFTAVVSVFRGTPPPKPLRFKAGGGHFGAHPGDLWADPIGGEPWHSGVDFSFASVDIIEMSRCSYSQSVHLSFL